MAQRNGGVYTTGTGLNTGHNNSGDNGSRTPRSSLGTNGLATPGSAPTGHAATSTAATPGSARPAAARVLRACKFLKENKVMENDEPRLTMGSLTSALRRFPELPSRTTKELMCKLATTVAELLDILATDQQDHVLNLLVEQERRIETIYKEGMGRLEDCVEGLQEKITGEVQAPRNKAPLPDGATETPFGAFVDVPNTRELSARNAEYIRDSQVLFRPHLTAPPENIEVVPTSGPDVIIADRFRAAVRDGELEKKAGCALLPLRARRLKVDILVDFPSPAAAKWIKSAEGSEALEHHLRYHMSAVGRKYKVVAHIVPTTFATGSPDALREIEELNELPPGCIEAAQWIKPERLRDPDQRHANLMLTLNEPKAANCTILGGVTVCGHWSQCWRQKRPRLRRLHLLPLPLATHTEPVDPTRTRNLRIFQHNLNKNPIAQQALINRNPQQLYDILFLQEPYIDSRGLTRATPDFHTEYPHGYDFDHENPARSVILVNKIISTDAYEMLPFPGRDVTAIQLTGDFGRLTIFNIYNSCDDSETIHQLRAFIQDNRDRILPDDRSHMIWLGDFNRHHRFWDDHAHTQLFSKRATREAEILLTLTADFNMTMALPAGIPTLQLNRTKQWHRTDNVWCSPGLLDALTSCDTDPGNRGPRTDHVPICTVLDIPVETRRPAPTRNIRLTNWEAFREFLTTRIDELPDPEEITSQEQLDTIIHALTKAIQDTIAEKVPLSKDRPHCKAWWTSELTAMRKRYYTADRESYRWRGTPGHSAHLERRLLHKEYARAIRFAKKTHWESWLDSVCEEDVWKANKFAGSQGTDGGTTTIPTLVRKDEAGNVTSSAATNIVKSEWLAQSFFPEPPDDANLPPDPVYPTPVGDFTPLDEDTVLRHLARLSPYKAPGPDGIQNIVLTKCADLIAPHLVPVYNAILQYDFYYGPWREFTTIVLRKPGKPSYTITKAYRPIALLNTLAKVLTAIVTERLTFLCEEFDLLPHTQFGGRPGRATTDSMHYLTDIITTAWAQGKVVSVLFLDIEGAFPNAVPEVLLHDLRMRRVPRYIVDFVARILDGRQTQLKFDGFESEPFDVRNGIPQGDPMSLILYLFYGAGLLQIPMDDRERALGFVDDSALVAIGDDFTLTHRKLRHMYLRPGGARDWATSHFSKFEPSKFKLMNFSKAPSPPEGQPSDPHPKRKRNEPGTPTQHKRPPPRRLARPPLQMGGLTIKPVHTHRFLGVIWDDRLSWSEHAKTAVDKGRDYALQVRRLARMHYGVRPKFVRRIYIGVVIPKMLYAVDVWGLPLPADIPCADPWLSRRRGSVGVMAGLCKVQRIAALTITGGMRSSPNDLLDISANLLPMRLLVAKLCYRALSRISATPVNHPLHCVARRAAALFPPRHRSPLQYLYHLFPELTPDRLEDITPMRYNPALMETPYATHIAETREESHDMDKEMPSVVRVYTDGSGYEGHAGAAAVLVRTDGVHTERRVLRYRLGPLTEHTVYEAETVGIILGAHLLLTEDAATASRPSSISLDNQAVIRATKHLHKAKPGHSLLDRFRDLAYRLIQIRRYPFSLGIYWISGHDDAELNEFVDGQAKLAAEGDESAASELPACLHAKPRLSVPAARQEYAARLKARWQEEWQLSPRYARHRDWAPDATSKRHLQSTSGLSRRDSTLLFQLRSGHVPLNAHLHRINCAPSPTCTACEEADETVAHFIYECPARQSERRRLKAAAGKRWRNRTFLLTDDKGIAALMAYVRDTGRIRGKRDDDGGRPEDGTSGGREGRNGFGKERGNGDEAEDFEEDEEQEEDGAGGDEGDQEEETDEGVVTEMDRFLRWFGMMTETERRRRMGKEKDGKERDEEQDSA
ncbi:unnamed protein product [Peniophora sp. CBMAI 1063]|nr:unnamed protein product [Peniophora sp. CBMAI 1063]